MSRDASRGWVAPCILLVLVAGGQLPRGCAASAPPAAGNAYAAAPRPAARLLERRGNNVAITLEDVLTRQSDEPPPGKARDEFTVTFVGTDGSRTTGRQFELPAGKIGTWEFRFTIAADIPTGGGFLIQRRGHLVGHRPQSTNPPGRDYVTLEAHTDAELELIVNSPRQSHKPALVVVLVKSATLRRGDSLLIRVGDRREGGPGTEVYDSTTLARFVAAVDRKGKLQFVGLASGSVDITITADPSLHMLRVLGPSIVAPEEPFHLHVVAHDIHRNVIEGFEGTVELRCPEGVVDVPEAAAFEPKDKGVLIVKGVTAAKPGLYRIDVRHPETGLRAQSNPVLCEASPQSRIYWGDLHCHTWGDINMALMCDNTFKLNPSARHWQARRAARLDFAAPGPASIPDQKEHPQVWEAHQAAFREHDAPGSYVPFLAFEVHPKDGSGDRNVIFRDWSDTYLHPYTPMNELLATYGQRDDVLLQPHVGGGPPNWGRMRTERERVIEVASGHGCFEWVLQRCLSYGYRPGVVASSDVHLPLLGGPRAAHSFRGRSGKHLNIRDTGFGTGPIVAVRAAKLTREAIWQAIHERRTYATTGARIILSVSVNGQPSGSVISSEGSPTVRVRAYGSAPVQRVDLIRGDRCVNTWRPDSPDVHLSFTDTSPLADTWYYVRLRQSDGEYAWSTPVWVMVPGGAEAPDEALPRWNAHEPIDLASLRPNAAERYEADLLDYLEREEDPSKFSELTPAGIVDEVPGRAAVFYGYLEPVHQPIMIRWYFEFEMPRIHIDWGWRDFGMADGRDFRSR